MTNVEHLQLRQLCDAVWKLVQVFAGMDLNHVQVGQAAKITRQLNKVTLIQFNDP
jgi:hypothetical protein